MSRPPLHPVIEAFERGRLDYDAAKRNRFRRERRGLAADGAGADYHYRNEREYFHLVEYCRDMDRNDIAVSALINRAVDNVLQSGFSLDFQTGDRRLDLDLWERFDAWRRDPDACDLAQERTFDELVALVLRERLVAGDVVLLPTRTGQLQAIECHRIRTPRGRASATNIVHGVELDPFRARVAYYIASDQLDPIRRVPASANFQRVPVRAADDGRRQVYHVYDPKRLTQTRGVSALAPMVTVAGMFEDIQFAKLVQQQVVSCFAIFRQLASSASEPLPPSTQSSAGQVGPVSDDGVRLLEEISPGIMLQGRPGETLEGFSPSVPNSEFFPHVRLMLQLIGINLGIPLVLLLLDASETNFSGWRGAIDQAKIGFRRVQQSLVTQCYRRVVEWQVARWLVEDAALARAAARRKITIDHHVWQPPTWPYIQPLQDASTDLLRVRNGLTSPRRMHAEHGDDIDVIREEIIADNVASIRAAKLAAMQINAEIADGQPVHWREVLSLPTPDGVTVSAVAPVGSEERRSPDEEEE